jgi:hypothetical protein
VIPAYAHSVAGVDSHPMRPSRHTQSLTVTSRGMACMEGSSIYRHLRVGRVRIATYCALIRQDLIAGQLSEYQVIPSTGM